MSDIPKAGTIAWYEYYAGKVIELGDHMELPEEVVNDAIELWEEAIGTSRSPLPLVVDCLYICAKLSGNRISIKAMKRHTKELWDKRIEVLPLDGRRNERRWVWKFKDFICHIS